jgi:hypothetical protein
MSLPPVVCRRAHVLFTLFVFVWYSGVQHILRCVLLSKIFKTFVFPIFDHEHTSRNTSCTLYYISTFLLFLFNIQQNVKESIHFGTV